MKRLMILIAMFAFVISAKAQDTTFVPNYGIDIMSYEVEQRMPNDTSTMRYDVRFNSKREIGIKGVAFYYDVKTFNMVDSSLVNHIKQLEVILGEKELNAVVQGKKVHEWLDLMMTPQDTIVQTVIAEIAYKFKVLGGN
jgi:hypothetical protein